MTRCVVCLAYCAIGDAGVMPYPVPIKGALPHGPIHRETCWPIWAALFARRAAA